MAAFEHDVVAAVLVHDGRALLCHRHPDREWFPDVWDIPGGHVDADESATDALARELHEELGIQIAQVASEPSATFYDGSELRIRVWAIDRWRGRVENRAPDEHDAIRWCSPEEIDGLDLADPRLADVVRDAIRHANGPTNASRVRRHLTIVLREPEVAEIAVLRRRWDPVLAAGVPPHVTVVYPEEASDFGELVDRARQVVPGFGAFELTLGEATTIDSGTGGVFIAVHDDGQSIRSLRERLVGSSTEPLTLGPHLTIAHPRTSRDGPACWHQLSGWSADVRLQIETVSYTETSLRSGMRIVETYRLGLVDIDRVDGRMCCHDRGVPESEENSVDDAPLAGGWQTTVHRVGNHVRRTPSMWSPSVIDFLGHLEREGFAASPRPVGSGFDSDGNELLTYVDGQSPHPQPWNDDAIVRLGALLAALHTAARSYQPADDAVWKDWFGRMLGRPGSGFGHGDLGPWNIMAIEGSPVGFIDWDTAGPMDPVYELAQAAWLNVQLHDDDIAQRVGLGDIDHRARQLRLLLDAYGLSAADRVAFVDKMVEVAVMDSAHEAVEHAVTPDTTEGIATNGYPFAWGISWRVRSAAWMLRHRGVLEAAIG